MMTPGRVAESVFAAMLSAVPERLRAGKTYLGDWLKDLAQKPGEAIRLFPDVSRLAEIDQIPATVLVLLNYPHKGDPATLGRFLFEYREFLSELELTHDPVQLRSKQVDHTVAFAAGADATPGSLAEVKTRRKPIFDQSRDLMLEWIGAAIENANKGLLGPLNRAIRDHGQETLEDMTGSFKWAVWERFTAASHLHDFSPAQREWLQFSCSADGVLIRGLKSWQEVLPFKPVPPGCRRVLQLWDGKAILIGPREFRETVEAGTQLVIRATNETESLIKVMSGKNSGPECTLREFEWARLDPDPNEGGTSFGELPCTCGTADCEQRHSILGWKEALRVPAATLASFVLTATVGPPRVDKDEQGKRLYHVEPDAFRGSMYYALLAEGQE